MNTIQQTFFAAIAVCCISFVPMTAHASAPLPETLQTVQDNAQAAAGNATHYQWKRVNWEVDRIIASEHQWEQTQTLAASTPLRNAVLALRSARADHNADGTAEAARAVAAQCALLAN